jgi:hypothetical protein
LAEANRLTPISRLNAIVAAHLNASDGLTGFGGVGAFDSLLLGETAGLDAVEELGVLGPPYVAPRNRGAAPPAANSGSAPPQSNQDSAPPQQNTGTAQ